MARIGRGHPATAVVQPRPQAVPAGGGPNCISEVSFTIEASQATTPTMIFIPDWGQGLQTDRTFPVDAMFFLNKSEAFSISWLATIINAAICPIDFGGAFVFSSSFPVESRATWVADLIVMAERLQTLHASGLLPIEGNRLAAIDREMPVEWTGGVPFVFDGTLSLDWLRLLITDRIPPLDTLATTRADHLLFLDPRAGLQGDRGFAVSWLQALATDRVVPVEWTGALGVIFDGTFPLDWRANWNRDHLAPAEWLQIYTSLTAVAFDNTQGIQRDASFAGEILARMQRDAGLSTDWTAQLRADLATTVSWLIVQATDRADMVEWIRQARLDSVIAIEWSGSAGFVLSSDAIFPIAFEPVLTAGEIIQVPGERIYLKVPGAQVYIKVKK